MENPLPIPAIGNAYAEMVSGGFDEIKVIEAATRARQALGDRASIAFLFVSCDLRDALSELIELVQIHARCPHVAGCSGGGLITTAHEEEETSGFSLLVLRLPNTELTLIDLPAEPLSPAWDRVRQWNRGGCDGWILLGNPVLLGEEWLSQWNSLSSPLPSYGGLASGSHRAEDLFVFDQSGIRPSTALAVGFRGGIRFRGLVSQGCRPIGEPLTITKADENLIHQLASRSAYEQLQSTFHQLSEAQRKRAQGNILIGLAVSEYVEDFHTGDFLVRSILGGNPDNGALAVGALPRVGQTLQFQLRDRDAASADLRYALDKVRDELPGKPFATLLFSCNGRGRHLFGSPNHDAALFASTFGPTPLAGFFCNGEIGSVGEKTYLHGFTASAVLLANP